MAIVNFYAGGALDRAAVRRKDAGWLSHRLKAADTRIVPYWRGRYLVSGPPESPQPVFLSAVDDWWRDHAGPDPAFLGVETGPAGEIAYFAVDLSGLESPETHAILSALGSFVELRALAMNIPAEAGHILAYARGLMGWHAKHRFCGVCGSPTLVAEAGHVRRCTDPACGTSHFPRNDPAVIMLVHDGGDRCLLGRQAQFPPGFYSTLAGFVEPGESLEDAVRRETLEETGVHVTDIRYHSSQPWPFPSSLMLGFTARATSFDVDVGQDELEDARWFDREWIKGHTPSDEFRLSPPLSISRRLIQDWLDGRA